jgi:hypothetical protein
MIPIVAESSNSRLNRPASLLEFAWGEAGHEQADGPAQVSSTGGKLRDEEDQETPDTNVVTFRFENRAFLTREGRSRGGRTTADPGHQVAFFGDRGTLLIAGAEVAKGSSNAGAAVHLQNFADAIRGKAPLGDGIEEGFKSALLGRLGNISPRPGRTIRHDARASGVAGDREAAGFWSRGYRSGWEPEVWVDRRPPVPHPDASRFDSSLRTSLPRNS